MKTKLLLLALSLSFLICGARTAEARLPSVASVGANTIVVQGVTYQVPASTRIEVDGLPSKLSDVHPGMLIDISQGLDRGTAESIIATTVPPVAPPQKAKTRSLTHGQHGNIVIAITDDRITYGSPGTTRAQAAFIVATTRFYVGGLRASSASSVTVGMPVDVSTTDGTHADAIRADDPNK